MFQSQAWLHFRPNRCPCTVSSHLFCFVLSHNSGSGTRVVLRILSPAPLRQLSSCIQSVCSSLIVQFHSVDARRILACGLTFLAFLVSLFMLRRGANGTARLPSFLTLGIVLLAAFITTITFLIDVIVVAVVRTRVHKDTDGALQMNWGNAVRASDRVSYSPGLSAFVLCFTG